MGAYKQPHFPSRTPQKNEKLTLLPLQVWDRREAKPRSLVKVQRLCINPDGWDGEGGSKDMGYMYPYTYPWRRQWHPTSVLLPGKSHGWGSLGGCSPWGHEESDTSGRLHFDFSHFMHWRRKWQPTPVFLPGESQGRGSLVGCRLWGHTESDTTEAT